MTGEMIYKPLGRTGLNVSIIGYGASPLGNEFGDTDEAEGRRAVHYAIDHGINYFDVAPYYGRTLAETRLGLALAGRRHDVVLATKVGRYDADPETGFDFSARRITASIDESLKRLQTDYVDVLQVHDIEFGRLEQIIDETLPALYKIKEQGKARFIGVTGYSLKALKQVAESADIDMLLSYCRYNLMDTVLEKVLRPVLEKRGIGLVNASPLHMRILTRKGAPDWHPAPEVVQEAGRQAAAWLADQGADVAELALQFALAYAPAATTLVGMSKLAHVERNIKLVGTSPDPNLLKGALEIIGPVADIAWITGRTANSDPGAIDTREV